jgi:hypothetical protein
MPCRFKIAQTLYVAIEAPMVVSLLWIRRYPQGFSFAFRRIGAVVPAAVDGRPGRLCG